jgi:hypothetical protein
MADVKDGQFVDALVIRAKDIINQARTGALGTDDVNDDEGPWDVDVVVRAAGGDRHNLYDVAGDGFVLLGDCWRDRSQRKTDAETKTETATALLYRSGAQVILGAAWPKYGTALRVTWNLPKPYWHPAGGAAGTKEGGGGHTVTDGDLDKADSSSDHDGTTGNDGRKDDADVGGTDNGGRGTTGPDEGDHDGAEGGNDEGDVDCDSSDDENCRGSNSNNSSMIIVDDDEEFGESAY